MKKSIVFPIACLLSLLTTPSAKAQNGKAFRVGFQTQELKGDFGLGLSLDIPLPARGLGLRLVGNNYWLEIPGKTDNQIVAFQTIRVGLAPDGWPVGEKIRVYGEGGALFIVPNDAMSPDDFVAGGYGVFGFEFYTKSMFGSSIFIEAGGCSTGVQTERREGVPAFGAGMILGAGFRVALSR